MWIRNSARHCRSPRTFAHNTALSSWSLKRLAKCTTKSIIEVNKHPSLSLVRSIPQHAKTQRVANDYRLVFSALVKPADVWRQTVCEAFTISWIPFQELSLKKKNKNSTLIFCFNAYFNFWKLWFLFYLISTDSSVVSILLKQAVQDDCCENLSNNLWKYLKNIECTRRRWKIKLRT
jgi:hypothetical protein